MAHVSRSRRRMWGGHRYPVDPMSGTLSSSDIEQVAQEESLRSLTMDVYRERSARMRADHRFRFWRTVLVAWSVVLTVAVVVLVAVHLS